jgi:hypothetical protein
MRPLAHDVRLYTHLRAAAIARPRFGGIEKLRAGASAAGRLVNNEAFQLCAEAFDKRLVGANRRPCHDSLPAHCDENLTPSVAAPQPVGKRHSGHVVTELSHEFRDALDVAALGRAYLHARQPSCSRSAGAYGDSVSRCVAVRCTAGSLKGSGHRTP